MGTIISAYRQPGGIQIHEDNGDGTLSARYVEEGAPGWLAALAVLPPDDLPDESATPALSTMQVAAIAGINRVSGEVRGRYVTILPGQEMIYLAKEAEARAWVAADPAPASLADFPMLAAEIGITADSAHELAQIWLNMSVLWRGVAAAIEAIRLGSIRDVTEATTSAEVSAAVSAAVTALSVF